MNRLCHLLILETRSDGASSRGSSSMELPSVAFLFLINFYRHIVDLQCCVSFDVQQSDSDIQICFSFFEVGCALVVKNGTSGKESACDTGDIMRHGFDPWAGKIPWRRTWQPTPVFLPGKSHGQRSLMATVREVARVRHTLATKPPPPPPPPRPEPGSPACQPQCEAFLACL